jgi:hypothetical protein
MTLSEGAGGEYSFTRQKVVALARSGWGLTRDSLFKLGIT